MAKKKISYDYNTAKIDPVLGEVEIDGKRLTKPDAMWISSFDEYTDEDYGYAEKCVLEEITSALKSPPKSEAKSCTCGRYFYSNSSMNSKLVSAKSGKNALDIQDKGDQIKRVIVTLHYVVETSQLGNFVVTPAAEAATSSTDSNLSDRFGNLEVEAQIKPAEDSIPALQLLELPKPIKVSKKKKVVKKKKKKLAKKKNILKGDMLWGAALNWQ